MTAREMIDWVEANVARRNVDRSTDELWAYDATRRLVAVQIGEEVYEGMRDMRVKDVAHMILDGDSLGGPIDTMDAIENWLADREHRREEDEAAGDVFDETLDDELVRIMKGFFNVE